MKAWQARIGILAVAIVWAWGYVATDVAIKHVSVTQMQVYRFGVGVILLCIIFHKRLKNMNLRTVLYGLALGVVFFTSMTIHSTALETTTVSKNAFLVVLNVAIVPIIMFVVFKVKVAKHFFVGVMMMIIGFFILVFNVDIFHLASSLNSLKDQAHLVLGDYLTLLSSFIFALHIVLIGYFVRKEDPINLVIIQLSVALILSALTCIINGEPIIHIEPTEFKAALPAIAYLSFSAAFGFSGQIAFQKYLPASNSALIFSTESLFASLTSVFLGFEPFSSGLLIGGIIITLGIVMAETGFKFKERTT